MHYGEYEGQQLRLNILCSIIDLTLVLLARYQYQQVKLYESNQQQPEVFLYYPFWALP